VSDPQQTNAYDEYAKNDDYKETLTRIDYADSMREVLARLQDDIERLNSTVMPVPNLINLVKTAQDYLFYLEDNRRTIV
jgi:hypothetical protein